MTRTAPRYSGVFPVVPTTFDEDGGLDLVSQRRALDFSIDAGSDGLCILANFSEQFALSDAERQEIMEVCLDHVAGRVPVIVAASHYSTRVTIERCRAAEARGAAMVMLMPPHYGGTVRVPEPAIRDYFAAVSDAIGIPIMVQDAPMSGTPLSVPFLASMAREIEQVSYFKIEVPQGSAKLEALIALGADAIEGPWSGEEGITLLADLDAGATGSMCGGGYPDGIGAILRAYRSGDRAVAVAAYQQWLPLILTENRQCGPAAAKVLMRHGGVIACDASRAPTPALPVAARTRLIEAAEALDPTVLRWTPQSTTQQDIMTGEMR